MDKIERRSYSVSLRSTRADDDSKATKIEGHAAVFNETTDLGWFQERIAPGAFDDTLNADVRALFNHDPNILLGRTTNKTLRLGTDAKGLTFSADPPDTQQARDVLALIERGDVDQASFGFRVIEETWEFTEGEPDLRTLDKVELFDVSPVTFPAYEGTDTGLAKRSYDAALAERTKADESISRSAQHRAREIELAEMG